MRISCKAASSIFKLFIFPPNKHDICLLVSIYQSILCFRFYDGSCHCLASVKKRTFTALTYLFGIKPTVVFLFAVDSRIKMENAFRTAGIKDAKTSVESDLLAEMVRQKSAMNVGKIYRQRKVSAHYSQMLLSSYMFKDNPYAQKIARDISTALVFGFGSHDCIMDYNTCKNLGLKAEKMSDEENGICSDIIISLAESMENGVICKEVEGEEGHREPSIRLYAEHLT
jgi:hypothetical protein